MTISDPRRYLILETVIGSGMNIVISVGAAFVSSGGVLGPPTLAGLLPQSFMMVFMSVLVATLLTRMRRRQARSLSGRSAGSRFARMVPRNALLRALVAGFGCLAIVAPIVATMLPALRATAPGPAEVGAVTAGYALLLSLLVTPAALILALNENMTA